MPPIRGGKSLVTTRVGGTVSEPPACRTRKRRQPAVSCRGVHAQHRAARLVQRPAAVELGVEPAEVGDRVGLGDVAAGQPGLGVRPVELVLSGGEDLVPGQRAGRAVPPDRRQQVGRPEAGAAGPAAERDPLGQPLHRPQRSRRLRGPGGHVDDLVAHDLGQLLGRDQRRRPRVDHHPERRPVTVADLVGHRGDPGVAVSRVGRGPRRSLPGWPAPRPPRRRPSRRLRPAGRAAPRPRRAAPRQPPSAPTVRTPASTVAGPDRPDGQRGRATSWAPVRAARRAAGRTCRPAGPHPTRARR